MEGQLSTLAEMECAIERLLGGELSPVQLQVLFWESLIPDEETSPRHPTMQLWHAVVTNLAFYQHCDFDREVLEASLRLLVESVRSEGRGRLTPITTSRCFVDAVRDRTIPVPLDPRGFHAHSLPCRSDECGDQCDRSDLGGAV